MVPLVRPTLQPCRLALMSASLSDHSQVDIFTADRDRCQEHGLSLWCATSFYVGEQTNLNGAVHLKPRRSEVRLRGGGVGHRHGRADGNLERDNAGPGVRQ